MPTPYGIIEARWEIVDGIMRLTVTAPQGTTGKVNGCPGSDGDISQYVTVEAGQIVTVKFEA